MRVQGASTSSHSSARMFATVAALIVLLSLAACTPTGSQSERVTPSAQPLYPQVRTYPRIVVAENLDYGSSTGGRVDVCLPRDSEATTSPRAAITPSTAAVGGPATRQTSAGAACASGSPPQAS